MFLIFAALAVLICLIYQAEVVPLRYSMDYGEAPLVDQAMRLANGQNIYRADISTPPYTISNYPPLYVAVVALGVKVAGPAKAFATGRLVSALSAWIAALCIAFIVHKATKDRLAAFIAATVFIAFPFVTFWSPLLRIDMFALALSLAGLALLVSQPISTPRFILSGLLLTAAIFTRQSYALAAPLAAFIWLIGPEWNWRRALQFAALVGGTSLVLFFILNTLTGGGFFFNIVTANVNEFGMDRLRYNFDTLVAAALLPLLIGVFSLFLGRRWNPLWMLAAPYLIGASLSALTIGKIGSNVNYLLELCAALGLAAGVVIAWSRAHATVPHSLRALLLILLALGLTRMMHVTLMEKTGDLRNRQVNFTELNKLETFVKDTSLTILADEYMGMLTLQGRPLVIQPFEVTQLAVAGKWDQTPLLESIRNHEFSAIILYDQPWSNERWTPEMLDAIYSSYTLSGLIAGNKIYTVVEQTGATETLAACPGAAWQLPNDAAQGVLWNQNGLNFYGWGQEGKVPVYAAADGLLTRQADWFDTVAILHTDPLNPSRQVWSIYSDMGGSNGVTSFVAEDFPPGATNVPVKAGQIVGYQGTWNGRPGWATWMHVLFAVIRADGQDFPAEVTQEMVLDPRPYIGIELPSQLELKTRKTIECKLP
jgi:hypothetical protein